MFVSLYMSSRNALVAAFASYFSTDLPQTEDTVSLEEDIAGYVELVDDLLEVLGVRFDDAQRRWQEEVDRESYDSVFEVEGQKPWFVLGNIIDMWASVSSGLPVVEGSFDSGERELLVVEEELYERSEALGSYTDKLRRLRDALSEFATLLDEVRRSHPHGDWDHTVLEAYKSLNEYASEVVSAQEVVLDLNTNLLERSKALAREIVENHEVLRDPDFVDSSLFRYYVLDESQDFVLLSYWVFHESVSDDTDIIHRDMRYGLHEDSTLPVEHVNLTVNHRGEFLNVHVVPAKSRGAWLELVG